MAADYLIEAGTPFIVKVKETVANPRFRNAVIKDVEARRVTAEDAPGYAFVGAFSPVTLDTNGTNLFLGKDGKLYYPTAEGNNMDGLRAYFVVPHESTSRICIDGEEQDAVTAVAVGRTAMTRVTDLQGRQLREGNLRRGIYIRDGRKVMVK